MNEIVFALEDLFEWTFQILPALRNAPNILALVLILIAIFYWLNLQRKYNKKAEEEGTLK